MIDVTCAFFYTFSHSDVIRYKCINQVGSCTDTYMHFCMLLIEFETGVITLQQWSACKRVKVGMTQNNVKVVSVVQIEWGEYEAIDINRVSA